VAINLRLYSRPGCHLCDEMLDTLMSMDIASQCSIQVLDIDTDPLLQKQFALRIPVLAGEEGNMIICEQSLDRQAVIKYLTARSS
jgi:hypothetical protein